MEICPKCNGEGFLTYPPPDQMGTSGQFATGTVPYRRTCPVCSGLCILREQHEIVVQPVYAHEVHAT